MQKKYFLLPNSGGQVCLSYSLLQHEVWLSFDFMPVNAAGTWLRRKWNRSEEIKAVNETRTPGVMIPVWEVTARLVSMITTSLQISYTCLYLQPPGLTWCTVSSRYVPLFLCCWWRNRYIWRWLCRCIFCEWLRCTLKDRKMREMTCTREMESFERP